VQRHPAFPAPSNFVGRMKFLGLARTYRVAGMRMHELLRQRWCVPSPLVGGLGRGVAAAPVRVATPLSNSPPQGGRGRTVRVALVMDCFARARNDAV
jgi:hypothetical protein